jgi:hypothetical protein
VIASFVLLLKAEIALPIFLSPIFVFPFGIYIYAISGFFFFEHPIVLRQDGKAGGTSLAPVYAFWQSCVSMSRCAETSFFFFFFFGCASSYYGVGSMRCPRGWQA